MDFHEIFREGWQQPTNKCLNLGGDPDSDRDTGETCFGEGMHCPNASSFSFFLGFTRDSAHFLILWHLCNIPFNTLNFQAGGADANLFLGDRHPFNGLFFQNNQGKPASKARPFWILTKQEKWHQVDHNANYLHFAPER